MALWEKVSTAIILALVILFLTLLPSWSMEFLFLLGLIASAFECAMEVVKKEPILPVRNLASAVDASADSPVEAPVDTPLDAIAPSVNAPVDTSVDASALSVATPALAEDALALPADALLDASAQFPPVVAEDALALAAVELSVAAPASAVDAAVDSPVDAPVDTPVDAPALSVTASVDASIDASALSVATLALAEDALALPADPPLDASAQFPPVVAAGVRMRRKKKLVVKVDIKDDRDRRTALRAVSALEFPGITALTLDSKNNELMVLGDFDPVEVVNRLKKSWRTEIIDIGSDK